MEVLTRKNCYSLSAARPVNLSSSGGSRTVWGCSAEWGGVSFIITLYRDYILKLVGISKKCINTAVGPSESLYY